MSVDKLVDSTQLDADLTSVANAIRTKGGTSASLAFPADFVSAIAAIPTGGGGNSLADLCNGNITRLDDDNITSFLIQLRNTSWNLQTIFLKNLEAMTLGYCFANTKVETVVLPSLKYGTSASYFFSGATSLTKIDLGPSYSTESQGIRGGTFNGASALNTLILRKSSAIVPLQNINAFGNTPFASGKAGGTIYIPKALYDHLGDGGSLDYKAATNWSTVNGYGTITWAKIEGSQYENYYADGTPIT